MPKRPAANFDLCCPAGTDALAFGLGLGLGLGLAARFTPQFAQKVAPAGIEAPQFGQNAALGASLLFHSAIHTEFRAFLEGCAAILAKLGSCSHRSAACFAHSVGRANLFSAVFAIHSFSSLWICFMFHVSYFMFYHKEISRTA